MKHIQIIAVGKTKNKWIELGMNEFNKKLKHHCSLSWNILKESNYKSNNVQFIKEQEEKKILKSICPKHKTIICDEAGTLVNSIEFANLFSKWSTAGYSSFDFILGGAFGVTEKIKKLDGFMLSLSPMTFTHEMVRVFLLEQMYRSFTILNGSKYHH